MENTDLVKSQQGVIPAQFSFLDKESFETIQRVCRVFVNSDLVPDMYRSTDKTNESKAIANCMIAIEIANRIGASPLMVMQNMVPIYGKPSWSSKFLIATVNTCGRFSPLQFKFTNLGKLGKVDYIDYVWDGKKKAPVTKTFDGTNIDDIECIAYAVAKATGDVLEGTPVSIRLAIQEGWYTKNGSKWVTMTKQMLSYRAASFWTSIYAPELSMGMKTEDEVRDIEDISYEDVTDKVEREKSVSANKQTIGFTPTVQTVNVKPEDNKAEGEKVVKNDQEPIKQEGEVKTEPQVNNPTPTSNNQNSKGNQTKAPF